MVRHPEFGYPPSAYQMIKEEEAEPKAIKGSSIKKEKLYNEKTIKKPNFY